MLDALVRELVKCGHCTMTADLVVRMKCEPYCKITRRTDVNALKTLMIRRPRKRTALLLACATLIGASLTIYACSNLAVAHYETQPSPLVELTARESGLMVGQLDESGSLSVDQFLVERARKDRFLRFMSSSDEPETVIRSITPESDGTLIVELATDSASAASGRSVLVLDETGGLLIDSNLANNIESTFSPRALFLPASLSAGEEIIREIEVQSKGNMFSSGSGEGTSTIRGIGTQLIEVPAGLYEAFVVESELSFSIGPARIVLTQRAWFAIGEDGIGIVAEEGRELVKVFGISAHNENRVSVLEEESVDDQSQHPRP